MTVASSVWRPHCRDAVGKNGAGIGAIQLAAGSNHLVLAGLSSLAAQNFFYHFDVDDRFGPINLANVTPLDGTQECGSFHTVLPEHVLHVPAPTAAAVAPDRRPPSAPRAQEAHGPPAFSFCTPVGSGHADMRDHPGGRPVEPLQPGQ